MALASVGVPIVAKAAFGIRDFDRYNGAFNAISGVISALAPILGGFIYDAAGSYDPAFAVYAAATLIFTAVLIGCLRSNKAAAGEKQAI